MTHRSASHPALLFNLPAIVAAWLVGLSPVQAAQLVNPSPEPAVQVPPVEVTAPPQPKIHPIFETNPLFLHTFADLRSGPMIEAIFWRHRYLQDHPQEQAVIVTTGRGDRILSATTVYTEGGAVYGSSNALGERFLMKGVTPTDLGSAAGIARASKYISAHRQTLLDQARPIDATVATPEMTTPNMGSVLVAAEESGDYSFIGQLADANAPVPVGELGSAMEAAEWAAMTALVRKNLESPYFPGPSQEIVAWTYEAMRVADRAGIVPVALGQIRGPKPGPAVPPFPTFTAFPREQPRVVTQPKEFITFDWEGIQYYYHPDVGTWARPLPVNSITGLPDLCIRHGELMECVYFCATYARLHPGKKAVLVTGDPLAAAYELDDKLGLFIPTLGGFTLGKQYLAALADHDYLGQIRDQVVAAKARQKAPGSAIPDGMPGDDGDMQMRRAFLAFQAAGISCRLHEEKEPSLDFSWAGVSYSYGADEQVRAAGAPPQPEASAGTLTAPVIKAPGTENPQLAGPVIPDRIGELPGMGPGPSKVATEDHPSPPAAANKVVVMPPLIVSATRVAKNPWRYVAIPGFEVLTRASQADTNWDLDGLRHGLWIQQAILPKEWLPVLPVPCTVIIDSTDLGSVAAGQPHSQQVQFGAPTDALTWGNLSGSAKVSSEPISSDSDTFAINSDLYGVTTSGATYASINLDRLRLAAPPLPAWVLAGLLGRSGLFREGFLIYTPDRPPAVRASVGSLASADYLAAAAAQTIESASGPGTLWISVADTQQLVQQLKRSKGTRVPLLPLGELFAGVPAAEAKRALWESEAALLVRWGLMGPGREDPTLAREFRAFVQRARQEPPSEGMFSACFGFGYAAMEDKLESFLKEVLAKPTTIDHLAMPVTFDLPAAKAATADQVGRILGDWLRMQGDSLRSKDPEITAACLNSAGQMLARAYRDDNALPPGQNSPNDATPDLIQDPRMLAVYGLYEHDLGNDAKARGFLEAAVRADVVRPRAYQILAELRFAGAVAKPLGANGRISGPQAAAILEPLKKALRFPASFDRYDLMVDVWGRCGARAASGDIEALAAGAALFPGSPALTFKAALVCARNGYRTQAIAMVHQGLIFATEPADQSRLEKLRSILESSPDTGAK